MAKSRFSRIKRNVPISEKQEKIFQLLQNYISKNSKAPTFKELSDLSGGRVSDALTSLRRRGMITWGDRSARSLEIITAKPKLPKKTRMFRSRERVEPVLVERENTFEDAFANLTPKKGDSDIVSTLKIQAKRLENELLKITHAIEVLEKINL
jgi:SOS-response transcriptional repressor LexA